jgi:hypothetical protein
LKNYFEQLIADALRNESKKAKKQKKGRSEEGATEQEKKKSGHNQLKN